MKIGDKTRCGYSVLQDLTKNSTDVKNTYASFDALKIRNCNQTTQNNFVNITVQRHRIYNISVEVLGEFDFPLLIEEWNLH